MVANKGQSKDRHGESGWRSRERRFVLETKHVIAIVLIVCVAAGLVLGGILGIFSN